MLDKKTSLRRLRRRRRRWQFISPRWSREGDTSYPSSTWRDKGRDLFASVLQESIRKTKGKILPVHNFTRTGLWPPEWCVPGFKDRAAELEDLTINLKHKNKAKQRSDIHTLKILPSNLCEEETSSMYDTSRFDGQAIKAKYIWVVFLPGPEEVINYT